MAITFLWIGILIFKNPEAWGGFIQPWVANLLPVPIKEAMMGTAVLDILIGFFLLINKFAWLAGAIGSAHLVIVLVTSGINEVTVRDIGLLGGAIAIAVSAWPKKITLPFLKQ